MQILLVETASPRRVRKKAEEILAGGAYSQPQLTVVCREGRAAYYRATAGVRVVTLGPADERRILQALRRQRFDLLLAFWTGEKGYRRLKWRALSLGARRIDVDVGDGCVFRLGWKALIRFLIFRWRHPLPSDHWEFAPPAELPSAPTDAGNMEGGTRQSAEPGSPLDPSKLPLDSTSARVPRSGGNILVIQSAEPKYVLNALDHLKQSGLFHNSRYTLFCRRKPEATREFLGHPMISEVHTHTEARGWWKHWRLLRRQRFDVLILFFTGDPSYWKIKYFAFFLGARRKLIFNENNDCFFFSLRAWLTFLAHRVAERSRLGLQPRRISRIVMFLFLLLKLLVLPFRFLWLLLVWLRLRAAALKLVV